MSGRRRCPAPPSRWSGAARMTRSGPSAPSIPAWPWRRTPIASCPTCCSAARCPPTAPSAPRMALQVSSSSRRPLPSNAFRRAGSPAWPATATPPRPRCSPVTGRPRSRYSLRRSAPWPPFWPGSRMAKSTALAPLSPASICSPICSTWAWPRRATGWPSTSTTSTARSRMAGSRCACVSLTTPTATAPLKPSSSRTPRAGATSCNRSRR